MATDFTAYKYSDAILPITYSICGVELRPLCLGHLMIMERLNNPIMCKEVSDVKMEDGLYWFFCALLICAMPYEDNIQVLNNDKEYTELMDKFTQNLLINMENDKEWNMFSKINHFKEYINYYMDVPYYTEEGKPNDRLPSGTDWKQNMFLIFKKFGYSDSEIYNMNLRKLFYTWCSYAESEGGIKVMNKMDLQGLGKL